jgi:hypothetical protein
MATSDERLNRDGAWAQAGVSAQASVGSVIRG